MKRFNNLLILCACLTAQNLVYGEAIRQPPSLQAGQQYRLAYVTSSQTTAESTDIDFYNRFVRQNADSAPIGEWGLNWKAIAGTEAVSARENTATDPEADENVPIFLLNGTELAPSYSAFWNAGTDLIRKTFDINELGEPFGLDDSPLLNVWTGSGSDGLPLSILDVEGIEGGPLGAGTHSIIGLGDILSAGWINSTVRLHNDEYRMYAMSEVLTAVPEPGSSFHLFVLLSVLLNLRKTRRI